MCITIYSSCHLWLAYSKQQLIMLVYKWTRIILHEGCGFDVKLKLFFPGYPIKKNDHILQRQLTVFFIQDLEKTRNLTLIKI